MQNQLTKITNCEAKFLHRLSTAISARGDYQSHIVKCMWRFFVLWAAEAGYKRLFVVLGLVAIYIFRRYHFHMGLLWCSCHIQSHGWGNGRLKKILERNPELGLDLPHLLYCVENEGTTGVDKYYWARLRKGFFNLWYLSFSTGLFHSAQYSPGPPRLSQKVIFPSFLCLSSILLCKCTTPFSSTHLLMGT